jgi:hypothetical protein
MGKRRQDPDVIPYPRSSKKPGRSVAPEDPTITAVSESAIMNLGGNGEDGKGILCFKCEEFC